MSELKRLSVVARCSSTGDFGLARLSSSMGPAVAFDGAVASTAGVVVAHGAGADALVRLGSRLLSMGLSATHVSQDIADPGPQPPDRQWAVLDREGVVSLNGGGAEGLGGAQAGRDVAVVWQGFSAVDLGQACVSAFESTSGGDLDGRLLMVLEAAAKCAKADASFSSAALVAWGRRNYSDTDLRVDLHSEPVAELRRIYDDFKPTAQYYEERARNPRQAMNAKEFAGLLAKSRAKST